MPSPPAIQATYQKLIGVINIKGVKILTFSQDF